MRRYATFFLIAVMTFGLAVLLLSRSRATYQAPAEILEAKLDAASLDAGASDVANAALRDAALADAAAPKPVERPMRIATLGWELAAPGAEGDGGATLEIAPEGALDGVEARLARGGADPAGADIAILPLPAFVVAYERLRAIDPRAFLVVGFSRGREEVHAAPGALSKPPPGGEEVKVVALAPSTASEATARAAGSESATLLGLFVLDLLGVGPARVRFAAPGTDAAKGATFAAITRGAADERRLALSTADASRLVPIVAVAPKAWLDANGPRAATWSKAWLDALARVGKDASGVARRLASKEGVPLAAGVGGAPEALALIERLGQVEPASPADQGPLFAGKGVASHSAAVTLASLTQRTWLLARGGGLTTTAAPDPLPLDARVTAAFAPAPAEPAPGGDADADAGAFAPLPTGTTLLAVYRAAPDANADMVVAEMGFLAGVFERAAFRVTAKGGEKAARAIAAQARSRFDLAPRRLATTAAEPAGAFASVEILSLP